MKKDEETSERVERQLRRYQDLRAQLNLPPLADEEQSRQSIVTREKNRHVNEARRLEQEDERKRMLEAWQNQVLATHEGVTVVRKMGDVFSQTTDGEQTLLPPPHFPFELNAGLDLDALSKPVVVDGNGYAWTRDPVLAFFSDDGSRLTVQWVACAHEPKYGWEYSHAIVQRVTWGRVAIEGRTSWCWMETIERSELCWGSSTEQWTSQCIP